MCKNINLNMIFKVLCIKNAHLVVHRGICLISGKQGYKSCTKYCFRKKKDYKRLDTFIL